MSSRPGHPTHTTTAPPPAGRAERAQRAGRGGRTAGPDRHDPSPERYEPYIDGLFTYCLSVLCEHDAATEVLGEVLALAERQHGRRPPDPGLYRPWLYALARWACLRRLADPGAPQGPAVAEESDRRRELSALAWPEAAGATPEQREALELSVRHGLGSRELAAVLGMEPVAARALLSTAACEVERTRAALLVAETGRCPEVARPAGDGRMLLSTALLRELVRHVDGCDECRRTAERATADGPWPGAEPVAQGPLPLVTAPRAAARVAMRAALRSRTGRAVEPPEKGAQGRTKRAVGVNGSAPRYDRSGFPLGPKDRAARNARLRSRALTTTVVATVVAAPVLALWAAYRGAPVTGETDGTAVTAGDSEGDRIGGRPYEKAGSAQMTPDPRSRTGTHTPEVSVEVIGARGERLREAGPSPSRSRSGPGRLTVAAQPSGDLTLITLAASGGTAVRWAAHTGAPWLQFSTTAGVLQPGETTTIRVYVDHDREPAGYWRARVSVEPAGAVITIEGRGATRPAPGGPRPTPTAPPSSPTPTPTPSPSDPSPSDPPPSDPPPSPTPTPSDPPPSDPTPSPSPSDTAGPSG
ncbi:RNA polymerase sigma factor [Streptomyces ochraceiscleroticus]|uniref:RNA polymerase sigma factor n=1 Tax=Streptomyces ochraceiscleroticus TaxID=47761 RepID=A0ABW1MLM3_9ACTN|nr:sigma-70 family RNA polymerase sigma factor [Streptomyces ochraceiscleroticus]